MSIPRDLYEFIVKIVDEKIRDIKVRREEFDRLVATVRELSEAQMKAVRRLDMIDEALNRLTEAQKRTEERINELAEVQRRAEERMDRLEEAIVRLAEAQERTEERMDRLEEAIIRLTEAQKRTEEGINELAGAQRRAEERVNRLEEAIVSLAEAQKRTEERVDRLEEAQRRTEESVNRLAMSIEKLGIAIYNLRVEVGRLSETIGFGLEDIAKVVLPGWLYRHLGIEVELERRVFMVDGREIEVDLYGVGVRDGRRVHVIGEVKSRIYRDDVEYFYENIFKLLKDIIGEGEFIGVLFGYFIHPYASDKARELGIYTVASYMR